MRRGSGPGKKRDKLSLTARDEISMPDWSPGGPGRAAAGPYPRCRQRSRTLVEGLEAPTFLSAGQLDPTFGTGGVAYPSRFTAPANASGRSVAFAPGCK